ncbi:MAG: response regulator transcription factor [Chitinophagaceae bacterium]|nr:response regulator transcription factor [Chitinophagaceae bacterium]MCW5904605.1 response regulator transcription factor [Chitinophagaceae bacterium]
MQKILLVDDDKNISEILEFNLKNEGFEVEAVYSAEEALKKTITDFQLILLDVMMEGMSGFKLAEKLRKEHIVVPIIFLTAKDTENDMLTGFSVGADDFIAKPFSIKEVIARAKAVLKRSNIVTDSKIDNNILTIGILIIDYNLKEVYLNKEKIILTKTEFELLALLAQKPESIFSRNKIIDKIWKETPYITERTVDVHITRLRKKLGEYAGVITNRSGYGYRFNADLL